MKIQYKEYTLEPEGVQYNLYKGIEKEIMEKVAGRGMIFKGTGKFHTVQENLGWGMSFEHCIEVIIKDSLASREDTFSLREYIDEYKQLKTKILEETK